MVRHNRAGRKPRAVPHPTRAQLAAFLRHINIGHPDDCWDWELYVNEHGYGRVRVGTGRARRLVYAHRLAYAIWYGDDLAGYVADHFCQNPRCCNPAHLQKVTYDENRARVDERGAVVADIPF